MSSLYFPSIPFHLFHCFHTLLSWLSVQLLQVALQKTQACVPDWFLLQPSSLPVHPQLHEDWVELVITIYFPSTQGYKTINKGGELDGSFTRTGLQQATWKDFCHCCLCLHKKESFPVRLKCKTATRVKQKLINGRKQRETFYSGIQKKHSPDWKWTRVINGNYKAWQQRWNGPAAVHPCCDMFEHGAAPAACFRDMTECVKWRVEQSNNSSCFL